MEKALATQAEGTVMVSNSFFFDMQRFADAQRVATLLSASSLLPAHFQKSVANCVIALNLADRLRVDPFMLMQNLYVVHGRPGIEGKLAIALVEGTGRFSPLKFKMEGQGKTKKGIARADACTAYATEIKTGEVIEGPPVTWEMADAEGWTKDKGTETSKWQTMPDLMFRYRSAMFFARVNCPGALLGLRSSDEIEDIEMAPAGPARVYEIKKVPEVEDEETKRARSEALSAAGAEFDKATTDQIKTLESAKMLAKYLDVASKHFKKPVEEIKADAMKDLAGFLAAYEKWAAKATQKADPKAPVDALTGADMAPGPCPNREDKAIMTVKFCGECKTREGCPAWAGGGA